jgi:hypothetical protein
MMTIGDERSREAIVGQLAPDGIPRWVERLAPLSTAIRIWSGEA